MVDIAPGGGTESGWREVNSGALDADLALSLLLADYVAGRGASAEVERALRDIGELGERERVADMLFAWMPGSSAAASRGVQLRARAWMRIGLPSAHGRGRARIR